MQIVENVMKPEEFHPDQFDRGAKYALYLELGPAAGNIRLPVLLVRGSRPGKRLVATAGVHGDEYEGVRTIFDVCHRLNPADMSGDFLSVPVSNPPAFWNGTRKSPVDDGNLARVFPGGLEAGPTSAIAYYMGPSIIARADLYIDLHSGGVKYLMPTMIGYDAGDARSREAAQAFGAKVLWGHPGMTAGRTITFADQQNIPWLYTEAHGAGRIDSADLATFVEGVLNLMRHLHILSGTIRTTPAEWHLYGDGDTDKGLAASQRGFIVTEVDLFQKVHTGDTLGRLCDLLGQTIETYHAPADGVIGMLREFPVVEAGEPLFLITGLLPDDSHPS
jgi:predicted deacylase